MQPPRYKQVQLNDFADFLTKVTVDRPCRHWIYRGAKDASYKLVPTLGRLSGYLTATAEERERLERSYLGRTHAALRPQDPISRDDFAAAVAAQHHGAPTRLLDWTKSPLIALYFAVEPRITPDGRLDEPKKDVAVFAAHCCPHSKTFRDITVPYCSSSDGSFAIEPPVASARVAVQQSVFTIAADPALSLEAQPSQWVTHIVKLTLPSIEVRNAQLRLHRLGITKGMLFPDADGINSSLVVNGALDDALTGDCNMDDET